MRSGWLGSCGAPLGQGEKLHADEHGDDEQHCLELAAAGAHEGGARAESGQAPAHAEHGAAGEQSAVDARRARQGNGRVEQASLEPASHREGTREKTATKLMVRPFKESWRSSGKRGIAEPHDEWNGRGKRRDVLQIELFELRQQPFAVGRRTPPAFVQSFARHREQDLSALHGMRFALDVGIFLQGPRGRFS